MAVFFSLTKPKDDGIPESRGDAIHCRQSCSVPTTSSERFFLWVMAAGNCCPPRISSGIVNAAFSNLSFPRSRREVFRGNVFRGARHTCGADGGRAFPPTASRGWATSRPAGPFALRMAGSSAAPLGGLRPSGFSEGPGHGGRGVQRE